MEIKLFCYLLLCYLGHYGQDADWSVITNSLRTATTHLAKMWLRRGSTTML